MPIISGGTAGSALGTVTTVSGTPTAGQTILASSSTAGAWGWAAAEIITYGTKSSNITTTSGTFAAGADVLAAALSFTADGTSDYAMCVWAAAWSLASPGTGANVSVNLDGANGGGCSYFPAAAIGSTLTLSGLGVIAAPAAGAHTVNARLISDGTRVLTMFAGTGGAGNSPAVVAVIRL